jgi:hypothetical protein
LSRAALEQAALAADLSGDPPAAVAARRALVQMDPGSPLARMDLARALEAAGDWKAALLSYQEALRRGADSLAVLLRMAELQLRLDKPALALQHLRKARELAPESAELLFRSGIALHRLGRYGEAAQSLAEAARLLPDTPEVHFNLGLARFETGDLAGALAALRESHRLRRGEDWGDSPESGLSREPSPAYGPDEMAVNDIKLAHDREQLQHLRGRGLLPAGFDRAIAEYGALLAEVRGITGGDRVTSFNGIRYPLVARSYKRPLHLAQGPSPAGPVINPALDVKSLESRYLGGKPRLLVIDGLLSDEALQALRRFCLESTVWNNIQKGYLGAYMFDGFASELLLRIARELRQRLPRIFRGHPLQMLWGYKYDPTLQGIGVHADAAAVNVNFWITPDEANLAPEGGGLLVWPRAAPPDWDFERFNRDPAQIMAFLRKAGDAPVRVPHRANRAVIFDSDLFHATDELQFREGYESRRVNVTMLYGRRNAS